MSWCSGCPRASTLSTLSARPQAVLLDFLVSGYTCRVIFVARSGSVEYPFPESAVARYDELAGAEGNGAVDGQTWQDLLLPAYLAQLGAGASIFGRQMLYRRLRRGQDAGAASSGRVRALLSDGAVRERLAAQLSHLREASAEVCEALFLPPLLAASGSDGASRAASASPLAPPPRWAGWLWLLPLAFLVCIAASFFWLPALVPTLVLSLLLAAIQVAFSARMQLWQPVAEALQLQLYVHSRQEDAPGVAQAAQLRGKLARNKVAAAPGVAEYADWFMLANLKHFFATRRLVREHAAFLRDSYRLVAGLDADLALARHVSALQQWCWAEEGWEQEIQLQAVHHPLLSGTEALDLSLEGRSAFISGQNGIGKSTLLRTVGLNLLAARAFGFCYAAAARVPNLPVYASMQNEDALEGGESLYQSELRRAQELLALAKEPQRAVFIIDEIFRGTNHLESVSAAAAVLEQLCARGTVLVSSHNVVLAQLLEPCCVPLLVQKRAGRLALTPGVLADTNGLTLLAQSGFEPAIEQRARDVYKRLSGRLVSA
ncbi:DNA mismatch repair protein MutS [Pseudoduganella eburnea]|uniref:DNA mismatch repair protein MutS n=1 Tax=Massilia eburnea TaxID=1776165 RepID=A0A6L6QB23_9BURK|nr:DNA mismatch repair protein MutS [Massilia eburnea]MTW09688.1 DNA mismatch repair protein MutS [Massilia eburnea]